MDDRAPAAANYTPLAGLDRLSLDGNTRTADNELYQPLSPLDPRDGDSDDAASSRISSMDSARPRATTSLEEEGAQRPPATRQPASQAPLLDVPGSDGGQSASAVTLVGVEGAAKEGEEAAAPGVTEPRWTPFHLRRPVLLAAAAVFVLMVVALEVLRYVSERDDGLATVAENMHYLWTYGPTTVLTVFAALWGQVEYRSKQIMPWSLMARGPTSMEHGLLLNYMTSTTLGSLYRSVRRRHFLVSIGISGSLILRLLIIFSTGLLSLEYRPMVYDKEFLTLDTLDLAKEVEYIEWLTDEFRPLSNGINFWAILNYNLSHPHGTTSEYAVQSFVPYENGTYDTMAADVQVFEAKLGNCESFNFTFERPSDSVEYFDIGLKRVLPKELWDEWEPWCYLSHSTYGLTNSVADGLLHELRDLMEIIYKCSNSTPPEDQEHRIFVTLESTLTGNETEMSGVISGNGDKLNITTEVKEELDLGIQPLNITAKLLTSYIAYFPMRNSPENPAIEVTPKDPTKSTTAKTAEPGEDNSDQSKWWHPIPTTWWFRICIILLALAVIIVLEVLFRLSGKNSGLADVDTNGYQKYTWTYIPTLTMASIGGLYIPVPVPWTRDVTLQMQDWFDIDNRTVDTLQSIAEENEPWSVFSLTQFSNMSYPQWTHGEYAFPTFSADDLRGHNGSETSLSNKNTSYDLGRLIGSPTMIVVDPPEGCHTPEINGTERRLYLKPSDSLKDGYFAAFMADDYDTVSLALYKEYIEDTSSIQICGDNRQHFWFAAGHQSGDISDSLTLLHCVPYIEALYVTANFSLPSLQLSTSAPVSPHEDTAIPLSTSSSATAFPDAKFDKFVAALANGTHSTPLASLAGQPNTAAFRTAIQRLYALYAAQNLHFNYRRPLSDPLPAANSTNNPAAAALASAPATGTLTDSTRLRLVQSGVSTRVLEGLLAAMVLFAGAAFVMERRTRILPKDPGEPFNFKLWHAQMLIQVL
ncbi:uncharacterized protein LTHEOB_12502 [Neofusicoccum parvum]|uniref:Uncharacterized protein LTHEOB_12502 n=1 Tax=Neofusicoccum parvum TaxID=310453 RepID=A0ACB5SPE0_9PEZI|nr:uncharacterized protein LTHEOB_12502 [Neofusicoccum parvum]